VVAVDADAAAAPSSSQQSELSLLLSRVLECGVGVGVVRRPPWSTSLGSAQCTVDLLFEDL
jgi:hypothetical protein